ncbi:carbohydrate ABC transporter permease [Kineococcus indalonis]|uniref:carbohydrate ABC transporter permease n=1 Tax=Kineococcus indalonis TaxID=2696566 RepID=UPI00196B4286|nr:carbohydrate ABC transporter permease [Kineococcus indalonis]
MSGQTDATRVVSSPTGQIAPQQRKLTRAEKRALAAKNRLSSPAASIVALAIAALWTIPTLGLFVTSFRVQNDIQADGWWNALARPLFTGYNYSSALQTGLGENFVNTFVITIPAVLIPITLALLAAYAFAWIPFKGREVLFVAVFALQVVPIQVTLIPLLSLYVDVGIAGSFWTVWLSHTMFGLPLAIFLLHNFMKDVPASLVEAARMDGAGHVTVFFKVLLPLLVPAIAAFGVFQFLWVWNDLLVALTFAGGDATPLTSAVADLTGTRGNAWHLLAPGAFLAMVVPLAVFLGLQRFFVRGLLAGSVKG